MLAAVELQPVEQQQLQSYTIPALLVSGKQAPDKAPSLSRQPSTILSQDSRLIAYRLLSTTDKTRLKFKCRAGNSVF